MQSQLAELAIVITPPTAGPGDEAVQVFRAVSDMTVDPETAFLEATRFIQHHGHSDKQQHCGASEGTSGP